MRRGKFISFEGGEGTGKTTQIRLLAEYLHSRKIEPLLTREPGGTGCPGAEHIRSLLLTGETGRWDRVTELLLMMASRREHLVHVVWPAIETGRWVVSDRFADSSMAYQGYGHGMDPFMVERVYTVVGGKFKPDLTIVLDIDPEIGLARSMKRKNTETRYERIGLDFHRRVREGFLRIAEQNKKRCVLIDANRPIEAVQADIRKAVEEKFFRT